MLVCENCGAVFEEEMVGKGYEEEKDRCPNCGDWGIREAKKCHGCGEWCRDDLCDNCKKHFKDAVRGFINMYCKELNMSFGDVTDLIEDCLEYGYTVTIPRENIE